MSIQVPLSYHFPTAFAVENSFVDITRWHRCTGLMSFSKQISHLNLNVFLRLPKHFLDVKKGKAKIEEEWATESWLTVQQVCELLSISKSTFYKWRMMGNAPQAKRLPNGDLRIRQDWLGHFMSNLPEGI